MKTDLTPVFEAYRQLRANSDRLFAKIASQYPECVSCKPGCSDCCHALFDLSLVEAMHINEAFRKKFDYGPQRSAILERASSQDRELTRLKRSMFHNEKEGKPVNEIIDMAGSVRMRCPLLDENDRCMMYEERPITCRIYGVPVAIGGKSHVCGFSAFEQGRDYPAVQLARIQARLEELSAAIAEATGSPFELTDIYVPLSMALLTRYDDAWFGLDKAGETR